jgi:hypothetical protein
MQVRTYLAIASWAVLAVALAQQRHLPVRREKLFEPASERIEALMTGIQKSLDDLTPVVMHEVTFKDASGHEFKRMMPETFGLYRVPPLQIMHGKDQYNTGVPHDVSVKEGTVQYYAVSCKGKPLAIGHLVMHKDFGSFAYRATAADEAAVVAFAGEAISTLRGGATYKGSILGAPAEARALVFSKPECAPCHRQSKQGDALAVMVFRTVKRR